MDFNGEDRKISLSMKALEAAQGDEMVYSDSEAEGAEPAEEQMPQDAQ